jgi:hypothetical protein
MAEQIVTEFLEELSLRLRCCGLKSGCSVSIFVFLICINKVCVFCSPRCPLGGFDHRHW